MQPQATQGRGRAPVSRYVAYVSRCDPVGLGDRDAPQRDRWARLGPLDRKYRGAHLPVTKNGTARTVSLSLHAMAVLDALPRRCRIDGPVFGMSANAISLIWKRTVAAAITGHKTLQMLKRYTHLRAEDLVDRLG